MAATADLSDAERMSRAVSRWLEEAAAMPAAKAVALLNAKANEIGERFALYVEGEILRGFEGVHVEDVHGAQRRLWLGASQRSLKVAA